MFVCALGTRTPCSLNRVRCWCCGLILYCLQAVLLLRSGLILYCLYTSGSPFALWISLILLTSGSPFALWINPILLTSGSPFALWISLILLRLSFWALDEHYNYCLRAALLLGSGLVLYCLRASSFIVSE